MATKPTLPPEWASSDPVDATSGQPAIIEPSAGKKSTGHTRLEKPVRQDHNWLFNLIYKWVLWLDQQEILNSTHAASDGTDHSDVGLNNTHRGSDGTDHSNVVLNDTHRVSNGSDHAIVNNNLIHVNGNGADHADVAQNTSHRNGDGSDHVDVGDNTTHRTGDGSDHADVAANTSAIGLNTTHRGLVSGNPHNVSVSELSGTLPVTGIIQTLGEAGINWAGNVVNEQTRYSDDFALAGVKVGDIVIVTPIRFTITHETNFASFEGIVASAGNIKIAAVNHSDTEDIDQAFVNALTFNITVLSFT